MSDKLEFMKDYAFRHKVRLELEGECGFGRECVGIIADSVGYPDYESWGDDDWDENNGEVWTPEDAYHKHPCVAVLGRGDKAESQLYEWLKWFDDNKFVIDRGRIEGQFHQIEIMMGKHRFARMVKKE